MAKSFTTRYGIVAALTFMVFSLGGASQADQSRTIFSTSVTQLEAERSNQLSDGLDLLRDYPAVKSFECTADKKTFVVAQTIIHASPQVVFAVLSDYPKAAENFSYLKKCQVVSSGAQSKQIAFDAIALSGAVTLSYVLDIKETPPYLIEFARRSGAFKQNEGYWKLEAKDSGKQTLVTFAKHIDAGMLVPKWFVVKELTSTAPKIMGDLRRKAEQDEMEIGEAHGPAITHHRMAALHNN